MIQFIHAADIHFGMENYGKIDPKTGIHTRLLDFQKSLNTCIDSAIKHEVDFFLFSGDAYKTANPSPTQQRLLFECFLRLFKADIPVVMIIGNHDNPLSFGKTHSLDLFGQLPLAGFYVIDKPTALTIQTKRGPVQIVGIPWPTKNTIALNKYNTPDSIGAAHSVHSVNDYISKAVSSIIQHHAQKLNPTIPAVLAAHLTVSTAIFSGSEKRAIQGKDPVFMPSQLALQPFDYVALGHIHRYQNLNPNGHPAVVYSGSIDRIDFGERKEEKGFCLVTIKNKQKTSHEFITIKTRPFIQVEVQLSKEKGQTDQIIAALKNYDLNGAIVKIIYHLPPDTKDHIDMRAIHSVCSHAMHLIGIFPVYKAITRSTRTQLNVDMDLKTLLSHFFEKKNIPKEKKSSLIDKALELDNENQETL